MSIEDRFNEALKYMNSQSYFFNLKKAKEIMLEFSMDGFEYAYIFLYLIALIDNEQELIEKYENLIRRWNPILVDKLIIQTSDPSSDKEKWSKSVRNLQKSEDFYYYYELRCLQVFFVKNNVTQSGVIRRIFPFLRRRAK